MASGRRAGSSTSIQVAGGRITVALYLRPSGLINLEQISTDLKKKVLLEPEKFISYLELLLVNIQRLNTVFLQSEESIEEVVKKLYIYKNSI